MDKNVVQTREIIIYNGKRILLSLILPCIIIIKLMTAEFYRQINNWICFHRKSNRID